MKNDTTTFSSEQSARAESIQRAAIALRGPFSNLVPDPHDVLALAEWIVDGSPAASDEPEPSPSEADVDDAVETIECKACGEEHSLDEMLDAAVASAKRDLERAATNLATLGITDVADALRDVYKTPRLRSALAEQVRGQADKVRVVDLVSIAIADGIALEQRSASTPADA